MTTERIYNPAVAEHIAEMVHTECDECAQKNLRQNFKLTGFYEDDGQGVFPELRCPHHGVSVDGDGDFHEYYTLVVLDNGEFWIDDKEGNEVVTL